MNSSQNKAGNFRPGTINIKGVHIGKTEIMTDWPEEKNKETNNQPQPTKLLTRGEIERYVTKKFLQAGTEPTTQPQHIVTKTDFTGKCQPTVVLGSGQRQAATTSVPQHEWPQGWLVVIEGPMKGKTFPILYGYNHIGRADSNRICLSNDPGISSVQCVVHYNSDERKFFIEKSAQASQETRISDGTLVNDKLVPLEAGEIIRLSPQTKLRFMPFCGDFFNWDYEC